MNPYKPSDEPEPTPPTTDPTTTDPIADGLAPSGAAETSEPPVPVTVWHIPDAWHDGTGDEFSPVLAGLLVALYSRPGDTVVSLGHDPALAGAAGAQGCTYVAVDDPADLTDLDAVAGTVRLIVLPPRTTHRIRRDPAAAFDLFTACRTLTVPAGCTVVALATLPTGNDDYDDYADLTPLLVPAARMAGLEWLHHIVAVTAPTTTDPTDPDTATAPLATGHLRVHVDLLVLAVGQGRNG